MYSALHNHTMFSLLDGYATPKEYLDRAKDIGLKAFAITEHGNEYSWCYFDKLKSEYPEIKMIYGVEFYECFNTSVQDKDSKYFHLIVLARNENGRKAINKLVTQSNFEGFYYKPRVQLSDFKELNCGNDLVVLSACLGSKIANEGDYGKCIRYIEEYKSIFPYFYLEMQSHEHEDQEKYNSKILQLSKDTDTPYVITTDSHAATKDDLYYQGRHVQIAHDAETLSEIYEGCYLQSDEEIHQIMDKQIGREAVDIGLLNTNDISDIIDVVSMPFQSPKLPTFPLPDGFEDNYDYLKYLLKLGWYERGFDKESKKKQEDRKARLEYELNTIHTMGYDGYFLIVWDFINYARSKDVMVAPGRGSCAGSLVCYTINITDLDPIKYGLIFERFLNPERISMPDTDTDVSNREIVINYLIDKYGTDRVCQIINFSYITPVVAIKDVGKILGFNYVEMDKLSKRFVYDTFEECLDNNKKFIDDNPKYKELFDIAEKLSGRVKTVSCHAGGVGIVDTNISDYMAMKLGGDGEHVIQVDKRIIEEIGIIKFDILGVQTLNMIKEAQKDANLAEYDININNPKFEYDKKAIELLDKALTNGVFQVESAGMKDLLLRICPKNMLQISDILALFRPDSMCELEDYIARANGSKPIEYIHPDLEPILKDTFGCMIYQEQLMEIVRVFGGRTYGGADKFRKGIGTKNKELVKAEAAKLYQEIINNGYKEDIARKISDNMREKGKYLFNKSHSMSYAVICLQTAFLKAHYTLFFFKALLNLNKDKAGMLNKYILDAKQFDINVLPPNINKSLMNFSTNEGNILFGLSAIKGIGENFANEILNIRYKQDKFNSMQDFIASVNPKKQQTVALIKSGAFPTNDKKKSLIRYLKSLYEPLNFKQVTTLPTYKKLEEFHIDIEKYRIGKKKYDYDKEQLLQVYNNKKENLFNEEQKRRFKKFIDENNKYLENEDFWEFESLQIFINNNPFDSAYTYLKPFEEVEIGDKCTLVGVIAKVQKKKDKNKKQFAFVNLYSSFGLIEGIVWHSTLKVNEDLVKNGVQVAILAKKDGEDKVVIDKMKSYNIWLEQTRRKGVVI